MTNILVVGGTGFVGQYLIKELPKNNWAISVICRTKRHGELIDIDALPGVKIFYNVDILDYFSLEKYFKNIDVVINLAGLVSFRQKDKENLIRVNCEGALNVLKACENNHVKKLIHLSSTAALGFSEDIINEDYCFEWADYKKCVYSYSKFLVNSRIQESPINQMIIYAPLVLGPGDKNNTLKLIQAIRGKKLPFNPPGRNSYIDVRDLASAIIFLLDKNIKNDDFIVASENFTFNELNFIIAQELNLKSPKLTVPKMFAPVVSAIAWLAEKLFENPSLTYENVFMAFKDRIHSSEKIKRLGWKPEYSLAQTIKDSIVRSIIK